MHSSKQLHGKHNSTSQNLTLKDLSQQERSQLLSIKVTPKKNDIQFREEESPEDFIKFNRGFC